MYTILMIIQVISAISIVALILLQQGKGADAGASFGGGASQTFFGSSGSGNFLTHSTAILVAVFFAASLSLAYYAKRQAEGGVDIGLPNQSTELPIIEAANEAASEEVSLPMVDQGQTPLSSENLGEGEVGSIPVSEEKLEAAPIPAPESIGLESTIESGGAETVTGSEP